MRMKSHFLPKGIICLTAAAALYAIASSVLKTDLTGLGAAFGLLALSALWVGGHTGFKLPTGGGQIPLFYLNIFIALLLFDNQAVVLMAALAAFYSSIRQHRSALLILFNSLLPALSTFVIYQALHFYSDSPANITYSSNLFLTLGLMSLIQAVAHTITVRVTQAFDHDRQAAGSSAVNVFLHTCLAYFALATLAGLLVKVTFTLELPTLTAIAITGAGAFLLFLLLVFRDTRQSKAGFEPVDFKLVTATATEPTAPKAQVVARAQVEAEAPVETEAFLPITLPVMPSPPAAVSPQVDEVFRQAFEQAPIAAALITAKGQCLFVNRPLRELLGYTAEEFDSSSIQRFLHPEEVSEFQVIMSQIVKGETGSSHFEKRLLSKDGQEVRVSCHLANVQAGHPHANHLLIQIQDITKRKESEEALLRNAFRDSLTGLPNRALFVDHLKLAINRTQRLEGHIYTVLFIDLDRFKLINDSLGHMVGDQLLITIARKLEQCLRPGDTIARVGGDEFTVLLEDLTDESEAISIANRIQKDLSTPFLIDGREVFTTVSIGVAPSSPGYDDPSAILRDADTAMYRAKVLGKNRYEIFDKAMHEVAVDLLQMETDLRHALARREFFIQYQPIVSLDNFSLRGFEALVRWRHPERGLISPLDFIPVAEDTGQILGIGYWVLSEACRQMNQWQSQFHIEKPLFISVNLSGRQFTQPDLVDQIKSVLTETGINPRCLKLEITESMVMENVETTTKMLYQLRDLGVQLSIDDFGTGYSSLSYLHRFPIDTLKIDRSFVIKMIDNNENIEIVRTIIILAQNLGMDVIAEGVETKEQLSRLRELKCENGQGYYFSKPLEKTEAENLLSDVCTEEKARDVTKETKAAPVVNTRVKSIKISPIAYL